MYVVFARKYRPRRFEDVIGQEPVTTTLRNAVRTGRVAQAYLFCGSRGVGKTTAARLLAMALNCKDGPTPDPCCECESCRRIATGDDMDVMEIDGASNRGIDEVRSLRQNVRLAPAHGRFKVYYIDEVHMLTEPAFNALLKTLEEPPAHVKFIFSTTDPQKIPETVTSRCQRFTFRRIPDAGIVTMLEKVCADEGLQAEPGALAAVARAARGSMRDALGTLDQVAAAGQTVRMQDVLGVLGAVDREALSRMVDAFARQDVAAALRALHALLFGGTAPEDFADQLSEYLRDLLVACYCGPDDPMLAGAAADAETRKAQADLFSPDQLTYMLQLLREARLRARRDTTGRIALELAVVKMARLADLLPLAEAVERLAGSGATDAGRPDPPPQRRPARPPADAPGTAGSGASASIARLKERLNNGARAAAKPPGAPDDAPPPFSAAPPAGVPDRKFREMMSCADAPETAREAMAEGPLRTAFLEGEKALGLNPVRLERTAPPDGGPEVEDQAPPPDETEE